MTIWKKTTKCFLLGYKVFGYGYTQDNLSKPYMKNLTKPYILERIEEIFEAHGLNDQFVDKQLEKLICQDADFRTKLGAIQEYNKMKGRITNKQEISAGIELKGFLPKPKKGNQ